MQQTRVFPLAYVAKKDEFCNNQIWKICNSDLQLTISLADLDDDDILVEEMHMYIILIMLDGLGRYIRSLETGKSCFIINKDIFKPAYTAFVQIKALGACYIFNVVTNRCTIYIYMCVCVCVCVCVCYIKTRWNK